jgi:hypothetical protein
LRIETFGRVREDGDNSSSALIRMAVRCLEIAMQCLETEAQSREMLGRQNRTETPRIRTVPISPLTGGSPLATSTSSLRQFRKGNDIGLKYE